jgi:hypothetical protein
MNGKKDKMNGGMRNEGDRGEVGEMGAQSE